MTQVYQRAIPIGGEAVHDYISEPPKHYTVALGTILHVADQVSKKMAFRIHNPSLDQDFQGEIGVGSDNDITKVPGVHADNDFVVRSTILEICMSQVGLQKKLLPFLEEIPAEEWE